MKVKVKKVTKVKNDSTKLRRLFKKLPAGAQFFKKGEWMLKREQ